MERRSNKTTPFEVYRYWRNVSDTDVMRCIRMLIFLPMEQIEQPEEGVKLCKGKKVWQYRPEACPASCVVILNVYDLIR